MKYDRLFEQLVAELRAAGIEKIERFLDAHEGAFTDLVADANQAKIRGEKGSGGPLEVWIGAQLIDT